jgi:hypothetical protein
MALVVLFNSRDTLGHVYACFVREWRALEGFGEFSEVLWLLCKHRIIVDAKCFYGSLTGLNLKF